MSTLNADQYEELNAMDRLTRIAYRRLRALHGGEPTAVHDESCLKDSEFIKAARSGFLLRLQELSNSLNQLEQICETFSTDDEEAEYLEDLLLERTDLWIVTEHSATPSTIAIADHPAYRGLDECLERHRSLLARGTRGMSFSQRASAVKEASVDPLPFWLDRSWYSGGETSQDPAASQVVQERPNRRGILLTISAMAASLIGFAIWRQFSKENDSPHQIAELEVEHLYSGMASSENLPPKMQIKVISPPAGIATVIMMEADTLASVFDNFQHRDEIAPFQAVWIYPPSPTIEIPVQNGLFVVLVCDDAVPSDSFSTLSPGETTDEIRDKILLELSKRKIRVKAARFEMVDAQKAREEAFKARDEGTGENDGIFN